MADTPCEIGVKTMEKRVWEFISRHELIQEGLSVGVAVSGGPDSMALLVCLYALSKQFGFTVSAVHFEHGIRGGESLRDADFVADYCNANAVPLYMGAADVPALAREWKMGRQLAAKRAREEYFESLTGGGDVDVIATAHHRDDAAESVLMHLLRGSGLGGLVGIHARYGNMIRPLLCVSRQDIMAYVSQKEIPFVVDSTNAHTDYTRNYVRGVLLPEIRQSVNENVSGALLRLAELAGRDEAYIEKRAKSAFDRCATWRAGEIEIDIEALRALDEAVSSRVIRYACAKVCTRQDIGYAHTGAVLRLVKGGASGDSVDLPHGLIARVEYGRLVVGLQGPVRDESYELKLHIPGRTVLPDGGEIHCKMLHSWEIDVLDPYVEVFDADVLPGKIMVRTRRAGDRFYPLGAPGSKKLKDYFIDKKLTRRQRETIPLLASGNEILWVVGQCMAQSVCVTGRTRRVMQARYTPGEEEGQ